MEIQTNGNMTKRVGDREYRKMEGNANNERNA